MSALGANGGNDVNHREETWSGFATIDFTEFGFALSVGSSVPLTDARLRQCCFLFRKSHRDYEERFCWQGVSKGGGQWRAHGVNF
jgi:hypothetical protein